MNLQPCNCDICPDAIVELCMAADGQMEYWDLLESFGCHISPVNFELTSEWYNAIILWKDEMWRYYTRNHEL